MSSEAVIRTRGLCKFYNVYPQPVDRLKQMVLRRRRYYTPVEAVKNVSVEIRRGETFGVVGRNGSGKSTFLQLVCGTLAPSMGELEVHGRVAALLELGAGFNPEFSGRENVFVSGAVMGLDEAEISRRFADITAFADIGRFIDQPVKNYSSGMYARLAFAVAINVDADILVVDEALSVGDEAFQRKCFSRIDDLKRRGCTILFVSHSGGTVVELCDRAMLLDRGECLAIGRPKHVVSQYYRMIYAPPEKQEEIRSSILNGADRPTSEDEDDGVRRDEIRGVPRSRARGAGVQKAEYDPNLRPASTVEFDRRGCTIRDIEILDGSDSRVNVLVPGEEYEYRYCVHFEEPASRVRFGMLMKLVSGFEIGGMVSHPVGDGIPAVAAGRELAVRFRFRATLNPGTYFMNAGVVGNVDGEEVFLHRFLDAVMFRIQPVEANCVTGIVDLSSEPFVQIEELAAP